MRPCHALRERRERTGNTNNWRRNSIARYSGCTTCCFHRPCTSRKDRLKWAAPRVPLAAVQPGVPLDAELRPGIASGRQTSSSARQSVTMHPAPATRLPAIPDDPSDRSRYIDDTDAAARRIHNDAASQRLFSAQAHDGGFPGTHHALALSQTVLHGGIKGRAEVARHRPGIQDREQHRLGRIRERRPELQPIARALLGPVGGPLKDDAPELFGAEARAANAR
jgi:hypothetical protein